MSNDTTVEFFIPRNCITPKHKACIYCGKMFWFLHKPNDNKGVGDECETCLFLRHDMKEKYKIEYVYFFGNHRHELIKIGFTTLRPEKRSKQIPRGGCYLIHCIEVRNARHAENFFHREFADKRIRGEWFALSPIDIDWIKSLYSDIDAIADNRGNVIWRKPIKKHVQVGYIDSVSILDQQRKKEKSNE